MKEVYKIELRCTIGTSNKEYHIVINEDTSAMNPNNRYECKVHYGRIGSILKGKVEVTKTSLIRAEEYLNKILKEKTSSKKGYVIYFDGRKVKKEKDVVLVTPHELLNSEKIKALVFEDVVFQEWVDGLRVSIVVKDNKFSVKYKDNKINIVTKELEASLMALPDCVLDAHLKDSELVLSDILEFKGVDLTHLSFNKRWSYLIDLNLLDSLLLAPTANGVNRKKELLEEAKDFNGCVVVKPKESIYSNLEANWVYVNFNVMS